MENEITVLIADDHPIFRRGLRDIIDSAPSLSVIAEADCGEQAMSLIELEQPKVAVLDIDMPPPDGLAIARTLQAGNSPVKPVILTMHKDESLLEAALKAGVCGYVVKDSAANEIVDCIKLVAAGRRYISPILTGILLSQRDRMEKLQRHPPTIGELTPSERRILKLIAESKTNREIAETLFISIRTVENHRANMCNKLSLSGKHALLTFAITHKDEI